ncbi:MAG TPA: SDR family NAD(P)-dependent oxidoreductase, partial [Rhodanobacter sp.]|nr:SDR family NAD(P)-dependent oxidoreductase [Rhodanobacter sp.]
AAIEARGGVGVPVVCDHADDAQVAALFARVRAEHGRLDILVNNVTAIPDALVAHGGFWEKPLAMQAMLDVGLRSSYVASWHAAPLLIANGAGLIVNTSSFGARCYMHGPAYGAGKAAVDKMAHDMAHELRPHGVAAVSLWMGLLRTERTLAVLGAGEVSYAGLLERSESPEFPGRVIDALACDPNLMARSGQVLIGAELALELGVVDIDGKQPPSFRDALGAPTGFSRAVVE